MSKRKAPGRKGPGRPATVEMQRTQLVLLRINDLRDAVMTLQGGGAKAALKTMSPELVQQARAFLKAQEKPKLSAPRPARRRALKRSKWAKVADEVLGAGEDLHYVMDQQQDRATQLLPIEEHRGAGRKPLTEREELARRLVIESIYRQQHVMKRRNPKAHDVAEATARAITRDYGVDMGAAEVEKYISTMGDAERIQMLGGAWPEVKRKLDRLRKEGVKPRAGRRGRGVKKRPITQ